VYRKDGSQVDVEAITVAISGARGETIGYLGIHRDVSERQRAEQAAVPRGASQCGRCR
jgi:PAS domain S-box-containing protein